MKLRYVLLLFLVSLPMYGCYPGITGKVVDAETDRPIEGAVVLVEWTKTKGFGLTYTESFKVVEVLSNKDGAFTIPGVYNPLVNSPDLTVYKPGYVAWNNKIIFPDYRKREDFSWKSGNTFKLYKFKDTYSYIDHEGFTMSAVNSTIGGPNDKQLFLRTYSEAEESKVIHEQSERDKQRQGEIRK